MTDKPKRKAAAQPPVSTHPAFPIIVAVWFAALCGIGSLVLPVALFERVTLATGLAQVLPAAQPPLGATARVVVALLAGLIGAGVGLFVARRIAAAQSVRPVDRAAVAQEDQPLAEEPEAKRPISAHEELGEGGFDAADTAPEFMPIAGRRRPLAMAEEAVRNDFADQAPLPGRSVNDDDEPLDLVGFLAAAEESTALSDTVDASAEDTFVPDAPAPVEPARATALTARPLGELGMVELVERFAHALEHHQARSAAPAIVPPAAAEVPAALQPFGFDDGEDEDDVPALDLTAALAATRAAEPLQAGASEWDEVDEPEGDGNDYPSLLAMKGPFASSRAPLRLGDDALEDHATGPVALFPGQAARDPFAPPAPAAPAAGKPIADAHEAENALRAALEKLQRLSGAA